MVSTFIKLTVSYLIIGLAAALPVKYNQRGDFGFSSLISPFLTPVTKAQQYLRTFGNVFAPVNASPEITDSVIVFPKDEGVQKRPFTHIMATSTVPSTISNKNNEISSNKKVEENMKIDKEILDKVFKDFSETDQNSITVTDNNYSSTVDYPTGTYEYETTTDYLLRIPAPVVASLLGK